MHELLGPHDGAAKCSTDGLVAQAHAQNWQLTGKVPDGRHRDARLCGRAGARRDHEAIELPGVEPHFDVSHGDFVVAKHFHLRTEFAEILDDVVGEAVVVVDHQEFHGFNLPV